MSKLELIHSLDDKLFNGNQKNERTVAVLINDLLNLFPSMIEPEKYKLRLPIVIRNQTINLQKESIKKFFPIVHSAFNSTELDILFLDAISIFGHKSSVNYFIEVEMRERDVHAFQRLHDFSKACIDRGISLYSILVSNSRKTGFLDDFVCAINISDFNDWLNNGVTTINSPLDIPGVAYDNAAIAYYLLDYISTRERMDRDEILRHLFRIGRGHLHTHKLLRYEIDFDKLNSEKQRLSEVLIDEDLGKFNHRISKLLNTMRHYELIHDDEEKYAYQLTALGSDYVLKWWKDKNV